MPFLTTTRPYNPTIQSRYHSTSSSASVSPSPSPSPPPPTIHNRRTLSSRTNSSSRRSPPPPSLPGLGLPVSLYASADKTLSSRDPNHAIENAHSNLDVQGEAPAVIPQNGESDAECWCRMLALQREYHCYNSARLEAAVEALEMGCRIEDVPMPSRFCLDLLNEELKAQIEGMDLY